MKSVRFRFSIRRMMVAVAIVAILLGLTESVRMKRRSEEFRRMAAEFERQAQQELEEQSFCQTQADESLRSANRYVEHSLWDMRIARFSRGIDDGIYGKRYSDEIRRAADDAMGRFYMDLARTESERSENLREEAISHKKRQEYFFRLTQKYEQAALAPWRSVEPDPPEPK